MNDLMKELELLRRELAKLHTKIDATLTVGASHV
jgi:hypothetical protein